MASVRYIEVEQVRSAIRRPGNQGQTLAGLSLGKIGRVRWVPDTPASRGMIAKVSHLVKINHDPSSPRAPRMAAVYDETADAALMRKLVFDPQKVTLEPYPEAEVRAAKRPDFKLLKDGELCGFCEMKSPRDDYVFENPLPGEMAVRKDLPFHVKLGRLTRKAGLQFVAANPDQSKPNILVFVNHAPDITRRDLRRTLEGLSVGDGKRVFMLCHKLQKQVSDAAKKVDLFLWIDVEKGTVKQISVDGAPCQQAALDLLGLSNEESPAEAASPT
jgi:large subunit ribosomal protein L30